MRLFARLFSFLPFCLAVSASGQDKLPYLMELENLPVLIDKAPPPSDRFPGSWYPGPSDETFRLSVEKNLPYTATLIITQRSRTGSEVFTQTSSTLQARDSSGRTRGEDSTGSATNSQGETVRLKHITVFDPVSHCTFQWIEPDYGPKLVALVQCLPRTIHYISLNYSTLMWSVGSLDAETMQSSLPKGSSSSTESLGKRKFGDVEAEGSRVTSTNATPSGEVRKSVSEIWYSPDLKEVVQWSRKDIPDPERLPDDPTPYMQLTNIKRIEPDPSFFYPPQGYEIQPESQ